MKPKELALFDRLRLKRRFITETVNEQINNPAASLLASARTRFVKRGIFSSPKRSYSSAASCGEFNPYRLKNISYIEQSPHRSINGFIWNLISGLIAYCLKEDKPKLDLTPSEEQKLITSIKMSA